MMQFEYDESGFSFAVLFSGSGIRGLMYACAGHYTYRHIRTVCGHLFRRVPVCDLLLSRSASLSIQ